MSFGLNCLINCMSASTPGLIPEKTVTDEILMKRPAVSAVILSDPEQLLGEMKDVFMI